MRAIQVTHHGGPEVLNYGTVDDPIPAPDEVIARTSAIGVNFIDTYLRRGMYPVSYTHLTLPTICSV